MSISDDYEYLPAPKQVSPLGGNIRCVQTRLCELHYDALMLDAKASEMPLGELLRRIIGMWVNGEFK